MKVKITYTVDMEDVLGEVSRIYHEAISALRSVTEDHASILVEDSNLTVGIETVDAIRKKLLDADLALADIDGILRSYMATRYQQEEANHQKELING